MAISGNHYRLLKEHAPLFKRGGSLLEIGEANWYGESLADEFLAQDLILLNDVDRNNLFEIAKCVYHRLWEPAIVEAVDINGTERAFRQDLNGPLKLPRQYDVVINHGTAEHVFNIAHVFKSMHDATVAGGYMVHESPFTGWVDHGFYNLNPTLFYDLAAANEYELISLSVYWIGGEIQRIETREQLHGRTFEPNALLYVVMRKVNDKPFRLPMQGVYSGGLSEAGKQAWKNNR